MIVSSKWLWFVFYRLFDVKAFFPLLIQILLMSLPTGIQKLVLAGRVGEAIEATQQLYPGLLEHNPNLLFMLK